MLRDQNSPDQLERLAAQTQLYRDAKSIELIKIVLVGPLAVVLALMSAKWPTIRAYLAFYAIAAVTADNLWLSPWTKSLRKTAAQIQELFDCEALQIPWNFIKIGPPPDLEIIARASGRYKVRMSNSSVLRDWYSPKLEILPEQCVRIACQRTNCWWDLTLRRRFKLGLLAVAICTSIILITTAMSEGITVSKFFLAVVAPAAPAWNVGMRRLREDSEAEITIARMKQCAEKLWADSCLGNGGRSLLETQSRTLQDEIFDHRCRATLIPDWFYKLFRTTQQEQMEDAAIALIRQFTSAKSSL